MIEISLRQFTAAMVTTKQILAVDPKCKEGYAYRGICQYKLHNTLPALSDFKKAAGFESPKMSFYFAKACFETGDLGKAKSLLEGCETQLQKTETNENLEILQKLAKQWIKLKDAADGGLDKAHALIS